MTTQLGKTIVERALQYAQDWKRRACVEDKNQSSCFQYLFVNNYKQVSGKPWCAAFCSTMLQEATNVHGVKNPLGFTMSTAVIRALDKKGVRVDTTPEIGAIGYYPREDDGKGHVFIIADAAPNGLITIEGNSSDSLKCLGCPRDAAVILSPDARSFDSLKKKGAVYVHVEEIGNTPRVNWHPFSNANGKPNGSSDNSMIIALGIAGAIGIGAYFAMKK